MKASKTLCFLGKLLHCKEYMHDETINIWWGGGGGGGGMSTSFESIKPFKILTLKKTHKEIPYAKDKG